MRPTAVGATPTPDRVHDGPEQHVHDPATDTRPLGIAPCGPCPSGQHRPQTVPAPLFTGKGTRDTGDAELFQGAGLGDRSTRAGTRPLPTILPSPHCRHLRLRRVGRGGRSETPGQASEETWKNPPTSVHYGARCSEIVQRTRKRKHV